MAIIPVSRQANPVNLAEMSEEYKRVALDQVAADGNPS
jgi:hypothetical protein